MTLDAIDLRILRALQENNRITSEQLGEVAGLSPTACQRRMRRLRDEKVIEGDVSIISPKSVGRHLTTLVQVSLERERADIIDRFKAAIRDTPEIMMGFYVTGDADFILVVSSRDMEDFEQFTRRFFYGNHDVKGFKTTVVIDRVKAGLALPIATP
jgi:Lrp/AsnC family leucine-responsive transcriptional regulator